MAKNPDLQNNVEEEPSEGYAPAVKDRVDEIWGAWSHIAGLLEKSKEAMAKQYDKHHIDKSFRISDEVYLQVKNIKTIRLNVKLDHWQLGPFTIINTVGKQSYKLQLPPLYRQLHPTFHVSLLEPHYRWEGEVWNPPEIPINGEDTPEWEIESIVADWRQYQKRQYLV